MTSLSPLVFLVAVGLAGLAGPAVAQPGDRQSEDRPALFEVGGGFVLFWNFGDTVGLPELHARVHLTPHLAIETAAAFEVGQYHRGLEGTYFLQARQTFGDLTRTIVPFTTYGVIGAFQYQHAPELRYTLASTGDTVVYPATTYRSVSRPTALIGGGGASIRLASHAFLELGAQVAVVEGIFAAFTSGITVPLGHGGSRHEN